MRRMWLLLILLSTSLASVALADDLIMTVDGKLLPRVRVRTTEGRVWIATDWLATRTGHTIKRFGDGAPVQVCRDDLCFVGPATLLTDDGREADLRTFLDVIGAQVELAIRVAGSDEPIRYDVRLGQAPMRVNARRLVAPGEPMPDVSLELVNGGACRISAFRGRKVVLVHWASW